jgi:hypothetical protein
MEASGSPRRFLCSLTRCDHFVSAHGKIGMCVHQHHPLAAARDCPHPITCSPFVGAWEDWHVRAAPPTHWPLHLIVHTRSPTCSLARSFVCSLAHRLSAHVWLACWYSSTIGTQTHSRTRTLSSLAHEQAPQHRGSRSTHCSGKQIWLWASQWQPPQQPSRGRRSCRRCKRGCGCACCSAHRVGASD